MLLLELVLFSFVWVLFNSNGDVLFVFLFGYVVGYFGVFVCM